MPPPQKGEASVSVDATPAEVYAVISDVTRTPEWSPECVACEWTGGAASPEVGATFRGTNRQGAREWSMDAIVDEARSGERFVFHTHRDGVARTRWGWRLEAAPAGGTVVTQFWERLASAGLAQKVVERVVLGGRQKHNGQNINQSLERVKAIVEASPL